VRKADAARAAIKLGELVGVTLTNFDVGEDELRLEFEETLVIIKKPCDMEVR